MGIKKTLFKAWDVLRRGAYKYLIMPFKVAALGGGVASILPSVMALRGILSTCSLVTR